MIHMHSTTYYSFNMLDVLITVFLLGYKITYNSMLSGNLSSIYIFQPKRKELIWQLWKLHIQQLNDLSTSPHYTDQIKEDERSGTHGTYTREEKCIQDFSVKGHFGDLRIYGRKIKWILKKLDGVAMTEFMWYSRDSNSRLLWTWQWTFGLHIMKGISGLSEELLASHKQLCSMQLVNTLISIMACYIFTCTM